MPTYAPIIFLAQSYIRLLRNSLYWKGLLLVFFFLGTSHSLHAQLYYIYLEDEALTKEETSLESIHQELSEQNITVRHHLTWLNALSANLTISQQAFLQEQAWVKSLAPVQTGKTNSQSLSSGSFDSPKLDTLLNLQRRLMNLDLLQEHGLTGEGVTIAVLDAGFKYTDVHPAFQKVREEGRILATRDFYSGGSNVYVHSDHGTQVLACMAGFYENKPLGVAADANFLLARTEHERKENIVEEDHWIAALEWAVEQGADIVSTSVNFTDHHYTTSQMDGKTAASSKAAAMAAEKGCLIVCAMGNEGDSQWGIMGAPADVPEVLSVGGSLPMMPMHIPFASVGPNSRGGLKPNVAGPAYVVTTEKGDDYNIQAGTSFACPLIAGVAACLLQQQHALAPKTVISILQRLGHHFPYYDFYLGFGVPDMRKLWEEPTEIAPTFSVNISSDSILLTFILPEDSVPEEGRVLSFHLEDDKGRIENCYFVLIEEEEKQYFFRRKERPGILRIWFDGYLYQKKFE